MLRRRTAVVLAAVLVFGVAAAGAKAIEPQVCSSCTPPLLYEGGPVLATNAAGALTVTPIFWAPVGWAHPFPAAYERIIDGYVANVAAASGKTDNVYSIDTEYYDRAGGLRTSIGYAIRAGTPIIDTGPFPASGCKPARGYSTCVTDKQLRAELTRLRLPTGLAHFYAVFLPPRVETKDSDGTTSADDYCGYHRSFGKGAAQTAYADMPFATEGCNAGQSPNGNLAADGEVDTLSHELNEAITDPLDTRFGWFDTNGNEIGDMCANEYGLPLGSTDPKHPKTTEYNQVINGGRYYTQSEFSNLAFAKLGFGKGCALSEALAQNPSATGTGAQAVTVADVNDEAVPTTLPADGKATSTVGLQVSDAGGYDVPGDHVHFSVGRQSGNGSCGKLSKADKTTDDYGNAIVTYTASTDNVACWVLGVDSLGGRSATAVVYQGTTRREAPTFDAAYPKMLEAGARPTTFTMVARNPSGKALYAIRPEFVAFPGTGTRKVVKAAQIRLAYSTTGPRGAFTTVRLTGSTGGDDVVQGYIGSQQGFTLPARSKTTFTFRIGLRRDTPVSKKAPLLSFEAYLDEINSASGSGATLADTYASDVRVPRVASTPTNYLWPVAIGAGVLAALAVGGFGIPRLRRS
jgi:hypothetical protein